MSIVNQVGGVNSLNSAASLSNNLLTLLGLKGWTLKNGVYNGCTFISFARIPGLGNIPGTALYESAGSFYASINSLIGKNGLGTDPNGGFGALVDTMLATVQFDDSIISQVAVKNIPYSNRCNTENTGFGGMEFRMSLLFLGTDYQKAIRNFENAWINPPLKNYLVLEHPTRGKIKGITRITSYKVITSLSNWNGATVNITFRSEESPVKQTPAKVSAKDIANALAAALALAQQIESSINSVLSFLGMNGNVAPNPSNQTKVNNIQKSNSNLSKILINNVNHIYKTSDTGVSNSTLSSKPVDYSYIPPVLNGNTNYSSSQGNYLIDYYQQQSLDAISVIKSQNLGSSDTDMINTINQSVAAFYAVTVLLASNTANNTYVTPYDMSVREVLARNGLPMSQANQILTLNQNIPSANYIPKSFVVNLS